MALIGFKCPLCDRAFTFRLDFVPEGSTLIQKCPICHQRIGLTSEIIVEEAAAWIIDVDAAWLARS